MSRQVDAYPHIHVDTSPTFMETLDQHKATSHLLEPQPQDNQGSASGSGHRGQAYKEYDRNHVRALKKSPRALDGERDEHEAPTTTTVFWKGLPNHIWTWHLMSIVLSMCFLGVYNPLRGPVASPHNTTDHTLQH
jgi:hypothetical protein